VRIQNVLLSCTNEFRVQGIALGELIRNSGKDQLWAIRENGLIDVIVLHYISAAVTYPQAPYDLGAILKIFSDYGVSSHFLIDRQGNIFRLVPEQKKAWHCGGSCMPAPDSRINVNEFSIGIELMATADSGFTALQYDAVVGLSAYLEQIHNKIFTYVGHDSIAGQEAVGLGLRNDLKVDPGCLFDWDLFRKKLSIVRSGNIC
jgi:N-acetyl-anhydromuramyl-L-alanine amidase AmpD